MSRNRTVNRRYQEQRDNDPDGLTAEERKFIDHYVISRNPAEAYFLSFRCKLATAKQKGSALLRKPHIAAVVGRIVVAVSQEAAKMAILASHGVLEEYTKLAKADPRELVEVVVRSCRYCHGKDNRFQFTVRELDAERVRFASKAAKKLRKEGDPEPVFDEQGGPGYNPVKNPPNPDCPECFGEGLTEVKVHPTSGISAAAARLYAGAKRTREGVEVKLHDAMGALDKMGQHHGLWKPDAGEAEETADGRAQRIRAAMEAMDDMTVAVEEGVVVPA